MGAAVTGERVNTTDHERLATALRDTTAWAGTMGFSRGHILTETLALCFDMAARLRAVEAERDEAVQRAERAAKALREIADMPAPLNNLGAAMYQTEYLKNRARAVLGSGPTEDT